MSESDRPIGSGSISFPDPAYTQIAGQFEAAADLAERAGRTGDRTLAGPLSEAHQRVAVFWNIASPDVDRLALLDDLGQRLPAKDDREKADRLVAMGQMNVYLVTAKLENGEQLDVVEICHGLRDAAERLRTGRLKDIVEEMPARGIDAEGRRH
ncbi:MAG: hypothetical protein JW809_14745 [Pirellulales bacterium]|nr:hypothetical protein [Pirellulales bacterium]